MFHLQLIELVLESFHFKPLIPDKENMFNIINSPLRFSQRWVSSHNERVHISAYYELLYMKKSNVLLILRNTEFFKIIFSN